MLIEEAKKVLFEPSIHAAKIYRLSCRLEELKATVGVRGISYDRERVQTSPTDQLMDVMCRCLDIEGEISRHVAARKKAENRIIDVLNLFPAKVEDVREILYLRYIQYWTPERCRQWLFLSTNQYRYMVKKGLALFAELADQV